MALITNTGRTPTGEMKPLPIAGLAGSTTAILGANQSWNTGIIAYNGNEAVHFAIASDVSGTYTIEYFLGGQPISFTGNPTLYDPALVNSFQGALSGKGDSFRLTYTNGSVAQTRFYLEVRFGDDIQQTLRSMGIAVSSTNMGSTTHAVIEGRENGTGNYNQVTTTPSGQKIAQDVNIVNQLATQPVSGSVSISNLPATQPITGSVSIIGSVEISNDSGNPLPVSGIVSVSNLPTTQQVTGTVTVSNPTAATDVSPLAKESGGNLAAILAKLTNDPATQTTSAAVLAALSAVNTDQGAPADAQATNSTASWSEIALLKGIMQRPAVSSITNVTTLATTLLILAANANRKGATIFSITGTILISLGSQNTANLFTARLITNGYYEVPFGFTGAIYAIGAGTVSVTELT